MESGLGQIPFFLMYKRFLFLCLMLTGCLNAQEEIDSVGEVKIVYFKIRTPKSLLDAKKLNAKDIELFQPEDLGQVLIKFSGTTLKSYGGLGGMKTLSVKGLGSQHTTVVENGFSLINAQTGQINLGQIQVDNIENVELNLGNRKDVMIPISARVSGNSLLVNTFEGVFGKKGLKVRSNFRVGSFGQKDSYLGVKWGSEKAFLSCTGKFRESTGDYPYRYQNGSLSIESVRQNNYFQDYHLGVATGIKLNKQKAIRIFYKHFQVNQELPGAIILYNNGNAQTLSTKEDQLALDMTHDKKPFSYRLYASYNQGTLLYKDPDYLNNSGGIENRYVNQFGDLGFAFNRDFKSFSFYGGAEERYSTLVFDKNGDNIPERFQLYNLLGATFKWVGLQWDAQVSNQWIVENNKSELIEAAPNRSKWNGFISIDTKEFTAHIIHFKSFFRSSMRMPSFNELYYNSIGNNLLLPEEANQISLGGDGFLDRKKKRIELAFNGYFSDVKNQILAIPNKNLFVWSMQNIGKVKALGIEANLNYKLINKGMNKMNLTCAYSFLSSRDFSDSNSPTYRHQIAYIPKHTTNVGVSYTYGYFGMQFSAYVISHRYALNENIPANFLPGFGLFDCSIFTSIKFKHKQSLKLNFAIKNGLNASYAFVKYYVMPGRNYLLTLSYALD
jgi:vitamin B12 transporter